MGSDLHFTLFEDLIRASINVVRQLTEVLGAIRGCSVGGQEDLTIVAQITGL